MSGAPGRREACGLAERVLRIEAEAILGLVARLDERFGRAFVVIHGCTGRVIVTGMGKSGHIGGKIAATLASTGTPAYFLHPAEGAHGDLGMVARTDVVVALSNSGETDEMLTPAEIAEITAYLNAHRVGAEPFDIAVNIDAPSDPVQAAEIIRPYAEAGATWYIALAPATPEEYQERIRNGPPKR